MNTKIGRVFCIGKFDNICTSSCRTLSFLPFRGMGKNSQDGELTILVLAIGKRERNEAYLKAEQSIARN